MGVWAEFEEKEFETLANAAFILDSVSSTRRVRLFSPGQVLEKDLGFDFATRIDPRSRLYRRLFGATPGAGVPAAKISALGISASRTTRLLNVFLQYKRPQYFRKGHRSPVWSRAQPHLAFQVREQGNSYAQVRALRRLQLDLGALAHVSYACPSVWQKQDLYDSFADGNLLRSTVFVGPDKLTRAGYPEFHGRWTFDPRNLRAGIPNPDGEPSESLDGEALLESLEAEATQLAPERESTPLFVRTERLSEGLRGSLEKLRESRPRREREDSARESQRIHEELQHFDPVERQIVSAAAEIALLARDARVSWTIAMVA